MITLNKRQIMHLHKKLLDATGGLEGVRDESLLDSALSAAFQTFDDAELYPSAAAKIARTAFGLVCNHPFADGNKRIGMYAKLHKMKKSNSKAQGLSWISFVFLAVSVYDTDPR